MKVKVKRLSDLSSHEIATWVRFQQNDPSLDSPFYSFNFSKTVDIITDSVSVALIEQSGDIKGFLPFHKARLGVAQPVGGQISDYQGIIGPSRQSISGKELLKLSNLKAYDFDHVPCNQSVFSSGVFRKTNSPYIDLKDGFDRYVDGRAKAGTKGLKTTFRKQRKIEREVGPIRFELNSRCPDAWRKFVDLKKDSYRRLNVRSILDVPWVEAVVNELKEQGESDLSGYFSALYAGDKLIAAHFGLRSSKTLHWWFPTYDAKLDKYSPGLILLLQLAKHASKTGITKIDLGRGTERYKATFSSHKTALNEGSIEYHPSTAASQRFIRKITHKSLSRFSQLNKVTELQRRGFNRILGSCYLPK